MRPTATPIVACTVVLLAAAACNRQDEEIASPADAAPEPASMRAAYWRL